MQEKRKCKHYTQTLSASENPRFRCVSYPRNKIELRTKGRIDPCPHSVANERSCRWFEDREKEVRYATTRF